MEIRGRTVSCSQDRRAVRHSISYVRSGMLPGPPWHCVQGDTKLAAVESFLEGVPDFLLWRAGASIGAWRVEGLVPVSLPHLPIPALELGLLALGQGVS